ncbi:unnamed protein product [Rhizophagus irregularis]|nr:unnamed protein product [Rhizophagus irregularis]
MSEVIEIEVDDIDKNDVDKNDVDKIFTFDDVDDKPHNGKPITIIETSPNENYLITYSEEDRSIVGWNVEDIDKVQLKFDKTVKIDEDNKYETESLCVSDDKKLCRIYNISDHHHDGNIDIIDMNNKNKIALSFYKRDKNKFETKNIGIFNNDKKFIFLKVNDKIIVYSTELEIPIANLDINDDTQLYNFMNHTGLFLLPSLFYYTPDKEIKYCWNSKYKNILNQTLLEEPTYDEPTDEKTDEQANY